MTAAPALPTAVCLDWRPVRRANPRSTLRGYADVKMPSGLVFRGLSICASDGSWWVVIPSRLRVDTNNVPIGVGDNARWDPVVTFAGPNVRTKFCLTVLDALRRDHPEVFGITRERSTAAA